MNVIVSGVTTSKSGEKTAYVYFTEAGKSAEIAIPQCEFVSNKGFAESEQEKLMDYVHENLLELKKQATTINPITALMKDN